METSNRRSIVAVVAFFFSNGLTFGSVLPRLPDIRADLGVSLSTMGVLLLCGGVGGLGGGLISGVGAARFGSRTMTLVGSLTIAVGVPLFGLAPNVGAYVAVAVVLGFFDGITDVGMNMQASDVDARLQRSVVNRFHAMWSVGTLVGAAVGSAAAALDISVATQLVGVSVLLLGVIAFGYGGLLPDDSVPEPAPVGGPSRRETFVALGVLAVAVAMLEAIPGEWSSLFGVEVHGASEGAAALGYVGVTAGMVLGRLGGDHLTDRFGGLRLLRGGLAVSGTGVVVAVTSPNEVVAIAGFFTCGLGNSVLFPALYLAAARRAGISAGAGLAAMTTGARVGFLSGPVLVGTLADVFDLRVGIGVVLGVALLAAIGVGDRVR